MAAGRNSSPCVANSRSQRLIDEVGQTLADLVKARLDRLDERDNARAHELALIKETVLSLCGLSIAPHQLADDRRIA